VALGRVRFGPEAFRFQERGGVSRYMVELHRALLGLGVDSGIEAGLHCSAVLDDVPAVRGRSIAGLRPVPLRQALTRTVDRRLARRARGRLGPSDIWHPSYFDRVPPGRSALAVTVYDMVHERYPHEVQSTDRTIEAKALACRLADVVLCISHATADDVAERLGLARDRLVVTPLGVTVPVPEPVTPLPTDRPTLLFIGDRQRPYKGWTVLLDALASGPADVELLCVGPPESPADAMAVAGRGLAGRVRYESPSDGQLASRYREVRALVYPSRYEGFGLPPLEALAQGCPVVAGRSAAIEEVVGDLALLVEPTVDGVGAGIARVLAGDAAVTRQRVEGPRFAARFTWEATARATLVGYERAVA
jgi:glycosyltransferase involved in cell wall biosynthesis